MNNINIKIDTKELKAYTSKLPYSIGVKVGFFPKKNKRYEILEKSFVASEFGLSVRKTDTKRANITNSSVAWQNVKGIGRLPKRNFFDLFNKKEFWQKENFSFLKDYYHANGANISSVKKRLANLGVAVMQRAIRKYNGTPLSKITIEKKKSSKQLIDSGQLIRSVTSEDLK